MTPDHSPPLSHTTYAVMAFDAGQGNTVLLHDMGGTWLWDGVDWRQEQPLQSPSTRYGSAMSYDSVRQCVILFGGWDGQRYMDAVWRYDPGQDRWDEMVSMPTARAFAGAATASGRIYILGGYDGQQALDVVEIYQPAKESTDNPWSTGLSMPAGRYAMGVTSAVDNIYVIGGIHTEESGLPLPSLEYVPSMELWQEFEFPVTENWAHLGMVLAGAQIFVLGGELDQEPTGRNLAYRAIYTVTIPSVIR